MTRPFLSIVTISFNQAPYLRHCIDNVVSQKGDDVEYIVVDPGSTDGSREIIASYGDAIDHLVLEPDQGPSDGLNRGFAKATGEVGYFINSDDFLLPGAIDRMRRQWAEPPDIDVLLGGAWMVDGAGEPLRELRATPVTLDRLLNGRTSIVQQGLSFRMIQFHAAGGFNPLNLTCWDYELLCAMVAAGARAQATEDRFGVFRLYDASLSGGASGQAHTNRYFSDLDRIHREFAGQPRPLASDAGGRITRVAQFLRQSTEGLRLVRDRLVPGAMYRRFRRDMDIPTSHRP